MPRCGWVGASPAKLSSNPRKHYIVDFMNILVFGTFVGFLSCLYSSTGFAESPAELDTASTAQSDVLLVQYPLVEDVYERDFDAYFLEIIELALKKSGRKYSFEPVKLPVTVESRSGRMLQENKNIVYWLNSSSAREQHLIPIKIPLFKGLIGWRVLLIRPELQAEFSKVKTLGDLRRYVAGQGHDWPDTLVLQENNLPVESSASWEGLFKMLAAGRIDYFPRSVIEIEREKRIFPSEEIQVENSLVLHYPAAYYLFVNKENTRLANALGTGLQASIESGEMDRVFNNHFAGLLANLSIHKRRIIELENSQEFPLDNPRLWYSLDGLN